MTVPEHAQADAIAALVEPGDKRMRLMQEIAIVDAELKPLVKEAVRLGVTQVRIMSLTNLSKNTIKAWAA